MEPDFLRKNSMLPQQGMHS